MIHLFKPLEAKYPGLDITIQDEETPLERVQLITENGESMDIFSNGHIIQFVGDAVVTWYPEELEHYTSQSLQWGIQEGMIPWIESILYPMFSE